MNYRHSFHAGNAADVVKHAVLARLLAGLARKETPFRVIETHAGAGLYDLAGVDAERTGEWRAGIGRVLDATFDPPVAALLGPWLDQVRSMQAGGQRLYPGSPVLTQALTRSDDRLIFCESEPAVARDLEVALGRDRRVAVQAVDGWAALPGLVPPPERRGLVLIDPPYEQEREFNAIVDGLQAALRRWSTGTYAIWHPIKGRRPVEHFLRKIAGLTVPGVPLRVLCTEILAHRVERVDRLNGSGVVVINPPWQLDAELATIGPALAAVLAPEEGRHRLEWLAGGIPETKRPGGGPGRRRDGVSAQNL